MTSNLNKPRVSVVVPTFNRAELMQPTLDSILAQTFNATGEMEVIVVDNASTDATQDVIRTRYAGRVRYIRNPTNLGYIASYNIGYHATRGDYVTVFDSDDLMEPAKIAEQVRYLDRHPDMGLVQVRYYHIDQDGKLIDRVGNLNTGHMLEGLLTGRFGQWGSGWLIRRECMERVNAYDPDTAPSTDTDLLIRLSLEGYQLGAVQKLLGRYRVHPGAQSFQAPWWETGIVRMLDNAFNNPKMPPAMHALKDDSYGHARFYISFLYYLSGAWREGADNLGEAIRLQKPWQTYPQLPADAIVNFALGSRVGDPLRYVTGTFDHLPPGSRLETQRQRVFGLVKTGMAFRRFAEGDPASARQLLDDAMLVYPAITATNEFTQLLVLAAVSLPVANPLHFVESVFRQLPPVCAPLSGARPGVLGKVAWYGAFEAHYAEHASDALGLALQAVRYQPDLLRNKGTLSVLGKSLIRAAAGMTRPAAEWRLCNLFDRVLRKRHA